MSNEKDIKKLKEIADKTENEEMKEAIEKRISNGKTVEK